MQNRRERRKILKQLGLLGDKKSIYRSTALNTQELGKEIHRQNMQNMRNQSSVPKEESLESISFSNTDDSYENFQSMLLNRNWENSEKD